MTNIVPQSRPKWDLEKVKSHLQPMDHKIMLLGVRGYYSMSMGNPGNDRMIYDDAIFLVAPDLFRSFNANTDPSAFRDGIATLKTGRWLYKLGIHGLNKKKDQQYLALVQASEVEVMRDNQKDEKGFFGINIHRGGLSGTSSLGCQTIHPLQWEEFIAAMKKLTEQHDQSKVPYVLMECGIEGA